MLEVVKVNTTYSETRSEDMSDGVITKYKEVNESYYAEKQEKSSVYEIPYIENVLFTMMSNCGRDMLLYIIYNTKKNTDSIELKVDKVCKQMNKSRPSYYKAIEELISCGIICKKHVSEYWINPFYFFKGNRIAYYKKTCPDCVKIIAQTHKNYLQKGYQVQAHKGALVDSN